MGKQSVTGKRTPVVVTVTGIITISVAKATRWTAGQRGTNSLRAQPLGAQNVRL